MDKEINQVLSEISTNEEEYTELGSLCFFVKQRLEKDTRKGFQSEVHGWNHLKFVAKKTAEYVKKEGGSQNDQKLGFIAGLFHDVVRPKPKLLKKGEKPPEVQSAEMAETKLSELGFTSEEVEIVKNAILSHSFGVEVRENRTNLAQASGLVADCLIAADKLRQFTEKIIAEREIFIRESTENPTRQEVMEYWKRRIEKAEQFLQTAQGQILLKNEPQITQSFEKVKQYFIKLCNETT